MYSFCKVEFNMDSSEECEVKDIFTITVPGDDCNSHMTMMVSSEAGSPFVHVVVKILMGIV